MTRKHEYTYAEFRRILWANGYKEARTNGSHHIYKRNGDTVVVPNKPNAMIVRRLIKEHDLIV